MVDLIPMRQQLERLRASLEEDCRNLSAQLDAKRKRLAAVQVLLTDEDAGHPKVPSLPLPFDAKEESLTDRGKQIVKAAGTSGIRPRDLTRRMREEGLDVKDTFASNLLWRMKQQPAEVVKRGGRYFPVEAVKNQGVPEGTP